MTLLLDMWLLIISHPSVEFDSHRSREKEFIAFLICYMTYVNTWSTYVTLWIRYARIRPHYSVKFGNHGSRRSWSITFFISRVVTWSCAQGVKRLDWWWPFTMNLYLAKFGSYRPRGSGDMLFFICHVINIRRIYMIILLQCVTIQFCRLFWHIPCFKVRQSNFNTKCERLLLQSVPGTTKCD